MPVGAVQGHLWAASHSLPDPVRYLRK